MKRASIAAALAAGATLALAGAASAEPVNIGRMTMGYTYYNRPGATVAEHNADISACSIEAAKTRSMDEVLPGSSGGLLGGLMSTSMAAAYHHGAVGASLENCMVVRGWRVVHLSDAEGKALAAQDKDTLASSLAPWIGAETPHGDVVRVWNNDASNSVNTRYVMRPDHTNDGPLSLKAATGLTLDQYTPTAFVRPAPLNLDPRWPTKFEKPAQLASAPPGSAIFIVGLKNVGQHNGVGLFFTRPGPDMNRAASTIDHAPDILIAAVGTLFAHKGINFLAIPVPPGRWRISNMGLLTSINFCLGSPSMEVKAGEVVYAGAFDLGGDDIGPDLSLEPVKTWLAGQPAAEKVQAASYVNGSRGACGDSSIYALEIKGAPFEPGYVWGSARPSAPAAPAPAAKP